jgi:hypothetical protein
MDSGQPLGPATAAMIAFLGRIPEPFDVADNLAETLGVQLDGALVAIGLGKGFPQKVPDRYSFNGASRAARVRPVLGNRRLPSARHQKTWKQ